MQFLVPFLMVIGKIKVIWRVESVSVSGSTLSVVLCSELGLDSWTCQISGVRFLLKTLLNLGKS